jgi:hypothetical protein
MSAAAEPSELVRERAMPHHRELAVRACQRCVQLPLPPDVLWEGSGLHDNDRPSSRSMLSMISTTGLASALDSAPTIQQPATLRDITS